MLSARLDMEAGQSSLSTPANPEKSRGGGGESTSEDGVCLKFLE